MTGFLGLYRIYECYAVGITGVGTVLLQSFWLGLGQFYKRSKCRKRMESSGMDETGVSVFCSGSDFVYLCVRNGYI